MIAFLLFVFAAIGWRMFFTDFRATVDAVAQTKTIQSFAPIQDAKYEMIVE